MTAFWRLALLLAGLALVSACQSSRSIDPLPAVPTAPVSGSPMEPLVLTPDPDTDPTAPGETDDPDTAEKTEEDGGDTATTRADDPPAPAAPAVTASLEVGRADLAGGWTLESQGETCRLFMSLTSWSGGYRATTKDCTLPQLTAISSWNLNEKQVQLKNAKGGIIAYLYPTAAEKFDGQTSRPATPISFFR